MLNDMLVLLSQGEFHWSHVDAIDDYPLNNDEDVEAFNANSKKSSRGSNYSVDEDEALVLAWKNVSLDPVAGKDQSGSTYWARMSEYFHANVKYPSDRSIGSLSHWWTSISECCTQWAGCVVNVERQHRSGTTMQERVCNISFSLIGHDAPFWH
jgi:hypothetical protein